MIEQIYCPVYKNKVVFVGHCVCTALYDCEEMKRIILNKELDTTKPKTSATPEPRKSNQQ